MWPDVLGRGYIKINKIEFYLTIKRETKTGYHKRMPSGIVRNQKASDLSETCNIGYQGKR